MSRVKRFIEAKSNDDFSTIKKMIIGEWSPEYITIAGNNQDLLLDIVENRPTEFYNIIHMMDPTHLHYCIKFIDIDYNEFYNYLYDRGFRINWIYNNGILLEISMKHINFNHEYKINMYEDCVNPSLLKIVTYALNHKMFSTFLEDNFNYLFNGV